MKLSQLLTPDQILLDFTAPDKWAAITAMARLLTRSGQMPEQLELAAVEALLTRERSMTTGMENGVAIPHAAMDELESIAAVLTVAPQGIPFETIDGAPGQILVGLLIPRQEKLLHIRTLAEIAKLLSRPVVREHILAATTPDAVLSAIRSGEQLS